MPDEEISARVDDSIESIDQFFPGDRIKINHDVPAKNDFKAALKGIRHVHQI